MNLKIKDEIKQEIEKNRELGLKIDKLMEKISIESNNKRDTLLAGFSRNLLCHFISINYLMENRLYSSAFSLERIFFENVIRLKYMYYIMDDQEIEKIYNANSWDKHFPKIKEMIKKIDIFLENDFYEKIKEKTYKLMNDFVHTGVNQIANHFSDTGLLIKSHFSDELILDTLKGNRVLLKTSIIVILESVGEKNGYITFNEIEECLNIKDIFNPKL